MRSRVFSRWFVLALVLFEVNCLSIFPGARHQEMEFQSEPSGARIEILSGGRRLAEGVTPATLDVPRHVFVARFSREGSRPRAVIVRPTDSRVSTSCLLSIPTLGFGVIVDLLTGAVSVHNPAELNAELEGDGANDPPRR